MDLSEAQGLVLFRVVREGIGISLTSTSRGHSMKASNILRKSLAISVDERLAKSWRVVDTGMLCPRNFFQPCDFQIALLRVNPKVPAPVRCKPILDRVGKQLSDTREPVRIPEHDFCFDILELPEHSLRRCF